MSDGLRPAPGKHDCLVLDVVGASRGQKLVTLVDLHETAVYDTTELDALPCEDCGMAPCECPSDGPAPELDTRPRLLGPAQYEDISMFQSSELNWLFSRGGLRFLPAGDRMAVLWPEGQGYLAGHCVTKGYPRDGQWLADGTALPLGQARELAEAWALAHDPTVASRSAGWRKRGGRASDAQVTFAQRL